MKLKTNLLTRLSFAVCGIALSVIMGLQAATNIVASEQPELAAVFFPLNGLALERSASRILASMEQDEAKIQKAAKSLQAVTMESFLKEPLVPKTIAIMALAENDEKIRDGILLAADKIDRRKLVLQTQLLRLYASEDNWDGTIGKVNEILAVHPEQKTVYLSALVLALNDPKAVQPMRKILAQQPAWIDEFFLSAISNKQGMENLVRLRRLLGSQAILDAKTDKRIIMGLTDSGKLPEAYSLYRQFYGGDSSPTSHGEPGKLDWRTQFPPFDWQLSEADGEHVEIIQNEDALRFEVKRGKGGLVAQRLISTSQKSVAVEIDHSGIPDEKLEDIFFEWGCFDSKEPVVKKEFSAAPMVVFVKQPKNCSLQRIGINARAWSHKGDLSGKIESVRIKLN